MPSPSIGPAPSPESSPKMQYLINHWSHNDDLRRCMQASDSESSDDERDHSKKRKMAQKKHKAQKEHKEHKKKRREDKRRDKHRGKDKASDTERSPRSIASTLAVVPPAKGGLSVTVAPPLSPTISPRLSACRTLPAEYRSSPTYPSTFEGTYHGQPLKPGLNLSPRKLPVSPSSSSVGPTPSPARPMIGPTMPPSFRL